MGTDCKCRMEADAESRSPQNLPGSVSCSSHTKRLLNKRPDTVVSPLSGVLGRGLPGHCDFRHGLGQRR